MMNLKELKVEHLFHLNVKFVGLLLKEQKTWFNVL